MFSFIDFALKGMSYKTSSTKTQFLNFVQDERNFPLYIFLLRRKKKVLVLPIVLGMSFVITELERQTYQSGQHLRPWLETPALLHVRAILQTDLSLSLSRTTQGYCGCRRWLQRREGEGGQKGEQRCALLTPIIVKYDKNETELLQHFCQVFTQLLTYINTD